MSAGKHRWWWHLWPGLVQIWNGRELDGLIRAVVFAVLLNTAVFSWLVWPAWLPPVAARGAWMAVAIFWLGSALESLWWLSGLGSPVTDEEEAERTYREAVAALLQGRAEQAEAYLQSLIRRNPADGDAAILMAVTAYRLGDLPRAHLYLERCRAVAGQKWGWETHHLAEFVFVADEEPEEEGKGQV